jgi:Cdc6-like AAA superfamily ATPase
MVRQLEIEARIAASGVREIFTPHRPIQSIDLFFGRQKTVRKLVEHLNTPGQHALLYGDRGVGKSSLANITTSLLMSSMVEGELYKKSCSPQDDFLSVFRKPLERVGVFVEQHSVSKTRERGGDAGLDIRVAKAGVRSRSEETVQYKNASLTPSNVAEFLAEHPGLLYVDETDQLDPRDKSMLATTIKLLSDCGSPFKILLVGIASTGAELHVGHASVDRCLKETKLERMTPGEIREIVENGSKQCGYSFDPQVVRAITELSSGYAHFTHLLALKCVEKAMEKERRQVSATVLHGAIEEAVDEAEGTLKRVYDDAVRSAKTDMFRDILYAAARLSSNHEFSARQWREQIEDVTGRPIKPQQLSNYLHKIVDNDESKIIKRLSRQGVYKFNDPRMPSYIKIASRQTSYGCG